MEKAVRFLSERKVLSRISLRKRFSVASILLVIGIVVSFSIIAYLYSNAKATARIKSKVDNISNIATASLKSALWNIEKNTIKDIIDAFLKEEDVSFFLLTDNTNDIYKKTSPGLESKDFEYFEHSSRFETKVSYIYYSGQKIGVIQLAVSNASYKEQLRTNTISLILLTLTIILAIYSSLNLMMERYIFKPLRKLNKSVTDMAEKGLDVKIDTSGDDEFGDLARAFDGMRISVAERSKEVSTLNQEIIDTQAEIIQRLGELVDTRSPETGNHIKRVSEFIHLLALKAGLSKEDAETLQRAAPLHDVGKVAVPDTILNKEGKFTPEEYDKMKEHAYSGYKMFMGAKRKTLETAAIIAHQHHERYDGKGYPQGLKGEAIHLYGRLAAIVDVFDAMANPRVYKPIIPREEIETEFKKQRGNQFDPALVDIFLQNLDEFYEILRKYSTNT